MTEQTIQSQDIKVANVFQAFYVVPDYQREYVWEARQVEQLLTDIHAELQGNEPESAPEYFIGSIVVCPGEGGVLELIDGQQRMTTLFLAFCAIRDRFKEIDLKPPGPIGTQIAATSSDAAGRDHFRYRLDLQYEDSGDVLRFIAEERLKEVDGSTRSIANVKAAYETISVFLRREFERDEELLRAYYGYLTNKVKLIRIETEDVSKALKIFETINDRGVGLDAMDLLKNLLFMKASRDEFDRLKAVWKEIQDTIFDAGEKPLRFLRYFIFSRYDVEQLREDEIYAWFAENEGICGYGANPIAFAKELDAAARAYVHFLDGRSEEGERNPHLENLQLLGGRAARQHLILLLAGRHLPTELFDRLAGEVENLFFAYVITRESTREFERSFARWAVELRAVRSDDDLDEFVRKRFEPARATLADRFGDAFRRLETGSIQQYRMRYILAKLTQHVELQAFKDAEAKRWLSHYTSSEYDVEHVFPQSPSPKALQEFGDIQDSEVVNRLGNLVLVEKSINASLGNKPYSEKRRVYPQSQLLLTRALAERPKIGTDTRIDRAVADLEPFDTWNEEAIVKRQGMMGALACAVWNMPWREWSGLPEGS